MEKGPRRSTAAEEWTWRENYRVWEANRKVFVYPENWIEPDLRDDKSGLFDEVEDELLHQITNEVPRMLGLEENQA